MIDLEKESLWKNQGGYFTLEASMIVPIVLFGMIGIFLAGLYLYDLGTAYSFLNRETVLITDTIKTNGENDSGEFKEQVLCERSISYLLQTSYPDRANEAKKQLKQKLQNNLIVSKPNNISFTAGQKKVQGKMRLSFSIPVPVIGEWIGKVWSNRLEVTLENGNNAEQMRRWDFLE